MHNPSKWTLLRGLAGTANCEPLSVFPGGRCIDFAAATNALLLRGGDSAIQSVSHSASRHLCTRDGTTRSRSDVRTEAGQRPHGTRDLIIIMS